MAAACSLIVLVVAMVTVVTAVNNGCGPLQILKVKNQWEKAYGVGRMRDDFGLAIWRT